MLDAVFNFLKEELNQHLRLQFDEQVKNLVIYTENDVTKSQPTFKAEAINLLLVNLESEPLMRPPDPYLQGSSNGESRMVFPPLRLNLLVLFAAGFKEYNTCLQYLSAVLRFFQRNPVFTPQDHPRLSHEIDRLVLEIHSLSSSQQNEIWSSLKSAYMPSVIYKVKMIVLQDIPSSIDQEIEQIEQRLSNR